MDFTILTGHRNKVDQDEAFATGRSQLRFPQSKHNKAPSWAVDIAPWPIDWNDRERFILLAGLVLGIGRMMGVNLRWGGDWNMNWSIKDESFFDLPHFELVA